MKILQSKMMNSEMTLQSHCALTSASIQESLARCVKIDQNQPKIGPK